MSTIRILCIGDVVGPTGCAVFKKHIGRIKKEYGIDMVIVNGENSGPRGRGITSRVLQFFLNNEVDVVTTGNHVWFEKEIYEHLDQQPALLRPANYPRITPGKGVGTYTTVSGQIVGVLNVQGRTFMRDQVDCPFATATSQLTFLKSKAKVIVVDFHAEATSEKIGLAHYLDGKVSLLFGTHTHVQTADERILPGGTAFISDLGMVGSLNSMLGMKTEPILRNFLTQMPSRFCVETTSPTIMSGVWVEVEAATGTAKHIERIRILDEEPISSLTE